MARGRCTAHNALAALLLSSGWMQGRCKRGHVLVIAVSGLSPTAPFNARPAPWFACHLEACDVACDGRCSVGMATVHCDDMSAFGSVRAIVVSAPAMAHRAGWSGCMRLCKPSRCRVCSLDVCRVDRHHESISITSHSIRLNGVKTRYTVPIQSLHGPLSPFGGRGPEVMPHALGSAQSCRVES